MREEVFVTLYRDDWRVDRSLEDCPSGAEVTVLSVPVGTDSADIIDMWESHQAEIASGVKHSPEPGEVVYLPELSIVLHLETLGKLPISANLARYTSPEISLPDMECAVYIEGENLVALAAEPDDGCMAQSTIALVNDVVGEDEIINAFSDLALFDWEYDFGG